MATHIVTLKDNNDDISYPITPVDAVFVDSNTTLADALDDKADADFSNVASGAITGGKIANNSITGNNIDWTTLGSVFATAPDAVSVTGQTSTSVLTVTVPQSGLYYISASGGAYCADYTSYSVTLGINGTEQQNYKQLIINGATSDRNSLAISGVFNLSANDVVNIMIAGNAANATASIRKGFTLAALRIG